MASGRLSLRALAAFAAASQWFTIGAHYSGPGAPSAEGLDSGGFALLPNDTVVPSAGCHDVGGAPEDSLRLGGADVHHHNYFANAHVREKLEARLA